MQTIDLVKKIVEALEDKKAEDITVLDIGGVSWRRSASAGCPRRSRRCPSRHATRNASGFARAAPDTRHSCSG